MNQAVSNLLDKIMAQVNKINKFDQLEGVEFSTDLGWVYPYAPFDRIMWVVECIVYKIVGSDKFTKWLWLHDFFEKFH
jgi:hypothetical protein